VQSVHRPRVEPSPGRVDAWTRQPPLFFLDKSRKLSKIVSVLQSASVERFDVSRMRDFLLVKRNNFQPMFKGSLTYELAYQEIEILEIIDSFLIHYFFLSNHFTQILCG